MKKLLTLILAVLFTLGLSACEKGYIGEDDPTQTTNSPSSTTQVVQTTSASNNYVDDIVAILNSNSYVLTSHDASSIQYFTENTLENNYQVYVTVTDLIMGDVGGSDWVQVIGFSSESEAITFTDALDTSDGGELYYRSGTAVLLTYSQNALDLFD